jgi:exonuclease SbcD
MLGNPQGRTFMKLLHTADWHLGRYLHGQSLLEDQEHALGQLISLAQQEQVDIVLIAGDVYDRSVPPAEAVALLDGVLARLVVECNIPVILIAGNHDSAERIGFASRVCNARGLHLRGTLDDLSPVIVEDEHGEIAFFPLPYADPIFARALPGGEHITDHQSAMSHIAGLLRAQIKPGQRSVLVGHAFVAGGSESESERPLTIGGSGMLSTDTFAGFDFVALGHLHRPQTFAERIHYAGSLLKYSFNEVDQPKSVSIIKIDAAGAPSIDCRPLSYRHDVRIVSGTLAELLLHPDPARSREDYLCAFLTDTDPLLEPMARLREVYPNMMELQFARQFTDPARGQASADHRSRNPDELFKAFFRDIAGEDITTPQLAAFNQVATALANDDVRVAR